MNNEAAVTEHFWQRWYKEYLVDLRESHKMNQQKAKPSIDVGDVVLIEEEGAKRKKWKLGRINKLVTGKDGVIRGAEVKTTTEKGAIGMVSRPIQKLYPLEVRDDHQSTQEGATEDTDGPSSVPMTLDTLTSNITPNAKNSNPSQNSLNKPSQSSSKSRRKKNVITKSNSAASQKRTNEEEMKSYESPSNLRPKRTAGVVGENRRRRVERKWSLNGG